MGRESIHAGIMMWYFVLRSWRGWSKSKGCIPELAHLPTWSWLSLESQYCSPYLRHSSWYEWWQNRRGPEIWLYYIRQTCFTRRFLPLAQRLHVRQICTHLNTDYPGKNQNVSPIWDWRAIQLPLTGFLLRRHPMITSSPDLTVQYTKVHVAIDIPNCSSQVARPIREPNERKRKTELVQIIMAKKKRQSTCHYQPVHHPQNNH